MIIFFLPCLFAVIMGPALMKISHTLLKRRRPSALPRTRDKQAKGRMDAPHCHQMRD